MSIPEGLVTIILLSAVFVAEAILLFRFKLANFFVKLFGMVHVLGVGGILLFIQLYPFFENYIPFGSYKPYNLSVHISYCLGILVIIGCIAAVLYPRKKHLLIVIPISLLGVILAYFLNPFVVFLGYR